MGSYKRTVYEHDVNSVRSTGLPTCVIGKSVVWTSDISCTFCMTVAILHIIRLSCNITAPALNDSTLRQRNLRYVNSWSIIPTKNRLRGFQTKHYFFGKSEMRTRYRGNTCNRHVCPHSKRDSSLSRCFVNNKQSAIKSKEKVLII